LPSSRTAAGAGSRCGPCSSKAPVTSPAAPSEARQRHQRLVEDLQRSLGGNTERLRVRKRTGSNLFRYDGRAASSARLLDLSRFNQPLCVDVGEATLDVEGFTTYEDIVDHVLPFGLLPTITPELKHITVGGAIVGIGIETNSYRYGFVHNALLEAEILLADGTVVVCTTDNEHADLLEGMANSYGTLGYVLRAKVRLRPAKPYVVLATEGFTSVAALLEGLHSAVDDQANDYLEGLAYARDRLFLTASRETEQAGDLTSIYGSTVFYREISRPGTLSLTTRDYLFRYDPEWFWALPESLPFRFLRRYGPDRLRHSGFYTSYRSWRSAIMEKLHPARAADGATEVLIQDWEVPWREGGALLEFVLDAVDLQGKPLMVAPLRVPAPVPCYPMAPGELYLNVGSYNYVRRKTDQPRYQSTQMIDDFCYRHGGIKMLYSSTFLSEEEFGRRYGGERYAALKAKYDPGNLLPTLFEKAVAGA
jgi:FAD/FMN-containing dehydrogenase